MLAWTLFAVDCIGWPNVLQALMDSCVMTSVLLFGSRNCYAFKIGDPAVSLYALCITGKHSRAH